MDSDLQPEVRTTAIALRWVGGGAAQDNPRDVGNERERKGVMVRLMMNDEWRGSGQSLGSFPEFLFLQRAPYW